MTIKIWNINLSHPCLYLSLRKVLSSYKIRSFFFFFEMRWQRFELPPHFWAGPGIEFSLFCRYFDGAESQKLSSSFWETCTGLQSAVLDAPSKLREFNTSLGCSVGWWWSRCDRSYTSSTIGWRSQFYVLPQLMSVIACLTFIPFVIPHKTCCSLYDLFSSSTSAQDSIKHCTNNII